MWRRITVVAVLVLSGCAAQREAERAAPDLDFQGPVRGRTLTPAQIKLVQQGIAKTLTDPASASFGASYRAGLYLGRQVVVCGYVNGKRFVGMFAKPEGGAAEFLPIKVAQSEEEQGAVRQYCRADGIYLPQ